MAPVDYQALFSAHREHLWGLCYRVTGSAAVHEPFGGITIVHTDGAAELHVQPVSTLHAEQPSLAVVLPSSQSSLVSS